MDRVALQQQVGIISGSSLKAHGPGSPATTSGNNLCTAFTFALLYSSTYHLHPFFCLNLIFWSNNICMYDTDIIIS